jgi:hypothetical protein
MSGGRSALALKFVYHLDSKVNILISVSDFISILA